MLNNIEFLKSLQEQMNYEDKCDNDLQAAPRFWVIRDFIYVPTTKDHADRLVLFDLETTERISLEEYVESIQKSDSFTVEQKEDLKSAIEDAFFSYASLEEWIEENDDRFYLIYEMEIDRICWNTFFITKKDAKEYLKKNKHNYSDKAHTFAMTAQSPQVEKLFNILMSTEWEKLLLSYSK